MLAKYNGFCKVTNQHIVAGVTEIVKVDGVWQCANNAHTEPATGQHVSGNEQAAVYAAIGAERQKRSEWCPDCGRGMEVERIPGGGISRYCEYCDG